MNPLEREIEKLGTSLPMLTREFEILEMIPVKRAKKTLSPAEMLARAERAERRKKKADAGDPPDPDDLDDDEDDEDDSGENSDDTGNQGKEAAGKRDDDRFDISISSEFPVQR